MKISALPSIVLLHSLALHAANLTFGIPTFVGSACPEASTAYSRSIDHSSLSLLFGSDFNLDSDSGRPNAYASCSITIPIQSNPHSLIDIFQRGFYDLPSNSRLDERLSISIGSAKSAEFSQVYVGEELNPAYLQSRQLNMTCNATDTIHLVVAYLLQSTAGDAASFALDSIDLSDSSAPALNPIQLCSSSASKAVLSVPIALFGFLLAMLSH